MTAERNHKYWMGVVPKNHVLNGIVGGFATVKFSHQKAEHSIGLTFWQTSLLWQRQMTEALKPFDLTHMQFVLLASTAWLTQQHSEVTQVMLSKHAKTDIMMTSKVLRTLEQKILIKRLSHSTDTRAKALQITTKGKNLVQKTLPIVEAVDRNFFAKLGKEQNLFHHHLLKLSQQEEK